MQHPRTIAAVVLGILVIMGIGVAIAFMAGPGRPQSVTSRQTLSRRAVVRACSANQMTVTIAGPGGRFIALTMGNAGYLAQVVIELKGTGVCSITGWPKLLMPSSTAPASFVPAPVIDSTRNGLGTAKKSTVTIGPGKVAFLALDVERQLTVTGPGCRLLHPSLLLPESTTPVTIIANDVLVCATDHIIELPVTSTDLARDR